jgi:hypothetical protein
MANDSPLQCLVGEIVTDALTVHDYVQMVFGTEMRLSIYNDFQLIPEQSRFEGLVGLTVTVVESTKAEVVIHFENGSRLRVDLSASAFRGPEAMQLNRAGHSPVIWN